MDKTQENLLKAFLGESAARNKYTFFANKARIEGFEWIARIFEETADNERAHAEREFEFIKGAVKTTNSYDIHQIGKTIDNLKAAAAGEKYEWGTMYPEFEKQAELDKNITAATIFKEIGEVEEKHEERYNILTDLLQNDSLYKSDNDVEWKCLNCGYVHHGKSAPLICPACGKPHGWYMPLGIVQ